MPRKDESKLEKMISFRIGSRAKMRFELLPIEQKHVAYRKLREVIARALHDAEFDARKYLNDDDIE